MFVWDFRAGGLESEGVGVSLRVSGFSCVLLVWAIGSWVQGVGLNSSASGIEVLGICNKEMM